MNCHGCRKHCTSQSPPRQGGLFKWFGGNRQDPSPLPEKLSQIALVGTPNVGKSVLFSALTGRYVTVSNYPGTTVEVAWGKMPLGDGEIAIVDTPGMYSLLPITDEERVARDLLLDTSVDLVIHVIDAKNLGRMLPLTLQLIEAGLPVLLAINMMDEAERIGLQVRQEHLEAELGIPVITLTATQRVGVRILKQRIADYVNAPQLSPTT